MGKNAPFPSTDALIGARDAAIECVECTAALLSWLDSPADPEWIASWREIAEEGDSRDEGDADDPMAFLWQRINAAAVDLLNAQARWGRFEQQEEEALRLLVMAHEPHGQSYVLGNIKFVTAHEFAAAWAR